MNCSDMNLARLCMQASQLTSLSNEAAVRLHETRGESHGILHVFIDVHSILRDMTVVKWFPWLIHSCFLFLQKVRRNCNKLAQKLSYVDTPWEMRYDPDLSSSLRSSTMPTRAGSSDTMAAGTSYVHTPGNAGKGPVEHDVEEDEDEEEEEEDYNEIGMS